MYMACRPGITGAATMFFCDEERMLAHIPEPLVEHFTFTVFNPLKKRLDEEYQRRASFKTDMGILIGTLLGRRERLAARASRRSAALNGSLRSPAPAPIDKRELFGATRRAA
jgi:lipopolysaccharide/colanic/teichoic acid biosynthesis glycosyltransferase